MLVPRQKYSRELKIACRLSAGGVTQTDQVRSGGSYLSQSDFRVHVGLGTATKIDSVKIRWLSGASDVIKNLEADKVYTILEGKGIVPFEEIRPAAPSHSPRLQDDALETSTPMFELGCSFP
jgi:hypothetical protein